MDPPLPRDAFPIARKWAYLNHAGIGPLSRPALEAIQRCARDSSEEAAFSYPLQVARAEEVRAAAAELMGVTSDEVAFIKNTTEGLGFVANGLDLAPGDRVVVPDLEFPSTIYPWLALRERGVSVDLVQPRGPGRALPIEAFEETIAGGPPPKVIACSWVQFGRGWRVDVAALARLARSNGALLCLDVIQGLGLIPARLKDWGVDLAMADAHKWLLGPLGSGVMYVRHEHLDRLRLLEPGWSSVAHRSEWENLKLDWDSSARRLEGGSLNMLGLYGLGASLDLVRATGLDAIWAHVRDLCDYAANALETLGATVLSDRSAEHRSGILTFSIEGRDPGDLESALMSRGVMAAARTGAVRISPHGYNTPADIDRLVEALR